MASDWQSIGIQLEVNLHQIRCQLVSDWESISIRLDVNWRLIQCQLALDCQSIDIPLVVHWYSIGTPVTLVCQSIGTFALDWYTPDLANTENLAEMEAPDWSRAQNAGFSLVERSLRNFQRGYPLNPESVPIESF